MNSSSNEPEPNPETNQLHPVAERALDRDLQQWIANAKSTRAPSGFSDRVMERLENAAPNTPSSPTPEAITEASLQRRERYRAFAFWAKAAVIALASLVGISRYGLLVFFILFR